MHNNGCSEQIINTQFWKRIELMSDLDFVLELHSIIKGTFALEYNESLEGVICV